jgi:adhesin transport system outer membrane protein
MSDEFVVHQCRDNNKMHSLSRIFLYLLIASGIGAPTVLAKGVFKDVSKELPLSSDVSADAASSNKGVEYSLKEHSSQGLRDSVSLALSNHPQLKAATQELYARIAEIEESESQFLPQLVLSLGIGREHSDNTSTRAFVGDGDDQMLRQEASVSLRQLLFDGFQTHWQRESGIELGLAQRFALINQAEMLAYDAIRVHLQVMRAQLAVDDHLDNLRAHEGIAKDVSIRARLGKDDRAKVGQISARLSLALANVEVAREKLRLAESEFYRVVGSLSLSSLASLSVDDIQPELPDSLESFLRDALANNPQMLAEYRNLKASQAEHKASKSSDYPSLYLESGASWNDNLDGVKGHNNDAYIMFRMDYDLFSGGAGSATKNKALRNSKQSEYQLEDARRELTQQVEKSWYSYQSLVNRVKLLSDYVDAAQSTKAAYIKQFEIGQRSLVDLLDAENELLKAKRLYGEAKYDQLLSRYHIQSLRGLLLNHLSQNVQISSQVETFLEGR